MDEKKKKKPEEGAETAPPAEKKDPPAGEQPLADPPEAPPEAPAAEEKKEEPAAPPAEPEEAPAEEQAKEEAPAPPAQEAEEPAQEGAEEPAGESLEEEVTRLRAEVAAYKADIAKEMVADAIVLALHDAKAENPTPDPAAMEKALKGVLKRHPEWSKKAETVGFRVGAGGEQPPTEEENYLDKKYKDNPYYKGKK